MSKRRLKYSNNIIQDDGATAKQSEEELSLSRTFNVDKSEL